MTDAKTEIYVQDQPWALNLGVWLVQRGVDGRKFIAPPVAFSQMQEGVQTAPSLTMSHEAAQDLMNRLWQLGIRPRDGEGTMAHVGAMKDHIADLRKIAFEHDFRVTTDSSRTPISLEAIKFGSGGKG